MKILKIVRGFTTNSSGSYEWLPPAPAIAVTTTAATATIPKTNQQQTQSRTSAATGTAPNQNLNEYTFIPANQGGLIFFTISIVLGVAALILIIVKAITSKFKNKKR